MIVAVLFLCLICGSALTSGSLYGGLTYANEEWWTGSQPLFLKFYSPSGKNYFIDYKTGEISLQSLNSMQQNAENVTSPYISFVSLDSKVFDIFFKRDDQNGQIPLIVQKQVNYEDKFQFIRHSLHSFVGPDKKVYTLRYNDVTNITVEAEKPETSVDFLQIKTFGHYFKWEHTYSFSQDGETATDLTISPVEVSADRSIPLAEMKADSLKDENLLIVNFNTPSGRRYLITNELNMARDQDELKMANQSYITFIEPNGKEYDIYFRNDGSAEYVANVVAKDASDDKDIYRRQTVQLFSFVGPDKKCYRINHKNETGEDVPVLDSSPTKSSEFQITFVVYRNFYYKSYVKFIYSNEGNELYDRVDELDSTLLAEQAPLSIDEVEANSETAKSSFLKFYSPSGRIYYLTPNETGTGNFAVAKDSNNTPNSPYISFAVTDGRTSNIYYESSGQTDIRFSSADATNSPTKYWLQSFVTPDKKFHKIVSQVEDNLRIPYIDITPQPRDSLDVKDEEALRIVIASSAIDYNYLFTWNGDKLVKVFNVPRKRVSSNVLKSLIG